MPVTVVKQVGFEFGTYGQEADSPLGNAEYTQAIVRTGAWAFRAYPSGAGTGYGVIQLPDNYTTLYTRIYIRPETLPGASNESFFWARASGGEFTYHLRINNLGQISYYSSGGGLLDTGATQIPTEEWTRIDIKYIAGRS